MSTAIYGLALPDGSGKSDILDTLVPFSDRTHGFRWITDSFNSSLRDDLGVDDISPGKRVFSIVTSLAQCFLNPTAEYVPHWAFHSFISTFSDFFGVNHVPRRSSVSFYKERTRPQNSSFVLQYHLRYFSPLGSEELVAPSREHLLREPLIRKRQVAWIGPEVESTGTGEKGSGEGYFKERAMSISLIMYAPRGTFQLVFLCDEGTGINKNSWYSHDDSIVPETLIRAPGLGHLATGMRRLLEWWHRGWNDTLAVIDKTVGFKVRFEYFRGLKPIFGDLLWHFVDDMPTRWTTPRTTMGWTNSCSMMQAS